MNTIAVIARSQRRTTFDDVGRRTAGSGITHSGERQTQSSAGSPDFHFRRKCDARDKPYRAGAASWDLAIPVPAPAPTMTLCSYGAKLTREELARVATPAGTATHKPIPHIAVVEKLIEALGFRQIGVVQEEYAVSSDGMRMFGVMDLSSGFQGCRFAIGLRNSHDKSFRLSCTVGLRVFVCENLAFHGEYTPVLAKHSKHFSLEDSLAIGVDRMQRNFGPLKQQVEEWQALQLSAAVGKAADLPGVHRGRIGVSEAPGAASARAVLSARA